MASFTGGIALSNWRTASADTGITAAHDRPAASGLNITATGAGIDASIFFTSECGQRYMRSA